MVKFLILSLIFTRSSGGSSGSVRTLSKVGAPGARELSTQKKKKNRHQKSKRQIAGDNTLHGIFERSRFEDEEPTKNIIPMVQLIRPNELKADVRTNAKIERQRLPGLDGARHSQQHGAGRLVSTPLS